MNEAFKADKNPGKILLGMGAYRDNDGKPFILDCVKKAEKMIFDNNMDHEYSGIDGIPSYREKCGILAFGKDSSVLKDNRLASC